VTIIFYPCIFPPHIRRPEYLWWRPEAPVRHNYALVSYGLFSEECRDVRRYLPPTLELMGDSGAFQLERHGVTISIPSLVSWQEENCNWGVPLDVLIGDFDFRLANSRRNFTEHLKYAQGKCKFLLPIHGPFPDEYRRWWEGVKDLADDYDGLAVASLSQSGSATPVKYCSLPLYRSLGIGFCIGKTDILHVFGLGDSKEKLAILVYAKKYFKRISCDASSLNRLSYTRSYKTRYWNRRIDLTSKQTKKDNRQRAKLTKLPCNCPACRMFEKRILEDSAMPDVENYLVEHHLYLQLEYIQFLDALSTDEELYREYCQERFPEIIKDLDFLDACAKEGFESAYRKFGGLSVWR